MERCSRGNIDAGMLLHFRIAADGKTFQRKRLPRRASQPRGRPFANSAGRLFC